MTHRLADLLPLAERNYTRLEAQDLLARCLAENDAAPLRDLINELLSETAPNLELLRDLLADMHAQWTALRERRFDLRRQVVEAFRDGYGVDITPLAPPQGLDDYHRLTSEMLLAFVRDNDCPVPGEELLLLREVFAESVRFAAELADDLRVVQSLLEYLGDWMIGFAGLAARLPEGQTALTL